MSKQYNIRWTAADEKALSTAVRVFNTKITKTAKKLPDREKNALPERASVKALKELITTRTDLERELNSLRRFMEKGAEEIITLPGNQYGTKITKWQKKDMSIRIGAINRRRNHRLKEVLNIEMTSRGESLGYTVGQFGMGKAEHNQLKPLKAFFPSMSQKDVKMRYKHMLKESQSNYFDKKDEILLNTYIKTLEEHFESEDIAPVINAIKKLGFKDFYKKIQEEGGVESSLEWNYPEKKGSPTYDGSLEKLRSQWLPNK